MAIDLGQLSQYQAEKGIKFQTATKSYHVEPTLDQGLAFQVALHERDSKMDDLTRTLKDKDADPEVIKKAENDLRNLATFGTYEIIAPLFGSKFHYPTKNKPPRFEGGILAELLESGAGYGIVDRLVTTLYLSLVNTDDVAAEFMRTGKLQKALEIVAEREKAEAAARATLKEPGETPGAV